jgi:hypothetical protein
MTLASHSQIRVPRNSWSHFTVSESRLPQPGGPGPRAYIPQGRGGPIIPQDTGLTFRRLLRLAELRWKHSTLRAHRICLGSPSSLQDNSSARTTQKTRSLCCCRGVFTASLHSNVRGTDHIVLLLVCACMLLALLSNGHCLQGHCLATGTSQYIIHGST